MKGHLSAEDRIYMYLVFILSSILAFAHVGNTAKDTIDNATFVVSANTEKHGNVSKPENVGETGLHVNTKSTPSILRESTLFLHLQRTKNKLSFDQTQPVDASTNAPRYGRSVDRTRVQKELDEINVGDVTLKTVIREFDQCYRSGYVDTCRSQVRCVCDGVCDIYGDCCLDAKREMNRTTDDLLASLVSRLQCVEMFFDFGYYFITSCSADNVSDNMKDKCININRTDVLSMTPIYDTYLKLSFRNMYCAMCNARNLNHLLFWEVKLYRCTFLDYNEMGSLTHYINKLLNRPNSLCRLIVEPHYDFRAKMCPHNYNDGYVCDGNRLTQTNELQSVLRIAKSGMTGLETSTMGNRHEMFNSSQQIPTEKEILNTQHLLEKACLGYRNVIFQFGSQTNFYRNAVCAWCIRNESNTFRCLSDKMSHSIRRPFKLFINLHSVTDIIRNMEARNCEENEIFDHFHRVCRSLICPERGVASYGKCIEPYIDVEGPLFAFTMVVSCSVQWMFQLLKVLNALTSHMELALGVRAKIPDADTWATNLQQLDEIINGRKYCYRQCVPIYLEARMTRHAILKVNQYLNGVFGIDLSNGSIIVMKLEITYLIPKCLKPIQKEDSSILVCPHITMNTTDFTALTEAIGETSVFNSNDTCKYATGKYFICYHSYKMLLESSTGSSTNDFSKPILSSVLLSVLTILSLIA